MNTSYFGNLRKISNPVSISLYSPKWFTGNNYKKLAPTKEILLAYKNKEINDDEQRKGITFNDLLTQFEDRVINVNNTITCFFNKHVI